MDSSSSIDPIRAHPIGSPTSIPVSPTSATQGLSNPGSFPASESTVVSPPKLEPGKAFEVRKFNVDSVIVEHSSPVLTTTERWMSPMERLFKRIEDNDREFVQQLPVECIEQKKLGYAIDDAHPGSGRTPLTAALIRGHVDLAVDLLLLGANPHIVDGNGRDPLSAAGNASIASMVVEFMIVWRKHGKPGSTKTSTVKVYQKLLATINRNTGHTLLTWAVSQHHDRLVELLIDSGADLRVCNRFGRTAIEEACVSGKLPSLSLLLDVWPSLASDLNRHYLIAAIRGAVVANRPMVVAQLLAFFRDEYRYQQDDTADFDEQDRGIGKVSDPRTQKDAFGTFMGSKPSAHVSIDELMRRTRDTWVLSEQESDLLGLRDLLAFSEKKGYNKIIEIIRAHARLGADD